MWNVRNLLAKAADRMDLPADVLAGLPRIELIGTQTCLVEPHKGLEEYGMNRVVVNTTAGKVSVLGTDLKIGSMNRVCLCIRGHIDLVCWGDRADG